MDAWTIAVWAVIAWAALFVLAVVLLGPALLVASREDRRERRMIQDLLADPDLPEAERRMLEALEELRR